MAKLAGYGYPQMLGLILKATEDRLALTDKARSPVAVPTVDPLPAPVNGHKVRALA
jgi:hypothetical protein